MTSSPFTPLAPDTAIPMAQVTRLDLDRWRSEIIDAVARGSHLAILTGLPPDGRILLAVLVAPDGVQMAAVMTRIEGSSFPSITPHCPMAHRFERELFEAWGLRPEGHPWLKPVHHLLTASPAGIFDAFRVEGTEVHEVAVGPVHAGVIEPGHFRFQCHGETVLHLEIDLGYQHRGVERALTQGAGPRHLALLETLAGDCSVGHALAGCQVLEALSDRRPGTRARWIRALALELERLANHTGDLGALAGDVGFLPTAAWCGRLRGDALNITAELAGNRFGRNLLRVGGVRYDVEPDLARTLGKRLATWARDVNGALSRMFDAASVLARFEGVGRVSTAVATQLGLVGLPARASGIARDVRWDARSAPYDLMNERPCVALTGDVLARADVRRQEIVQSVRLCIRLLDRLTEPIPFELVPRDLPVLMPDHLAVSRVETWRGPATHMVITGESGRLAACRVVDPSCFNWIGLAMAMREGRISDFPVCNKSFNLSYCGHDL